VFSWFIQTKAESLKHKGDFSDSRNSLFDAFTPVCQQRAKTSLSMQRRGKAGH
jgi:hypothetical protein